MMIAGYADRAQQSRKYFHNGKQPSNEIAVSASLTPLFCSHTTKLHRWRKWIQKRGFFRSTLLCSHALFDCEAPRETRA